MGNSIKLADDFEIEYEDANNRAVIRALANNNELRLKDDGTFVIVNNGLDLSSNGISNVSSVGGGGTAVTVNDDIDLGSTQSLTNASSVSTDEVQANNESFVRPTRSSDSSSQTAGDFINVFDGESKDIRSEFSASAQFSPDKDGEYFVRFSLDMRGNTSAGDIIRMRVQNVTDGTTPPGGDLRADDAAGAGSGNASPEFVSFAKLDSAKNYELQATNADSSYVISAFSPSGVIKRSVVQ